MIKILLFILLPVFIFAEENVMKDFKSQIETKIISIGVIKEAFKISDKLLNKIEDDHKARIIINETLRKFFKKEGDELGYNDIIFINNQFKVKFIKSYNFFHITTINKGGTKKIPKLNFAISRTKNKLYRFGRHGLEVGNLFGKIRKKDIKTFNKMIKKIKLKIFDNKKALDICLLFIKLSFLKDTEVIINSDIILNNFKKTPWNNQKIEKKLKKLKLVIKQPVFKTKSNGFDLEFFTLNSISVYKWRFNICKKGTIDLLMLSRIN